MKSYLWIALLLLEWRPTDGFRASISAPFSTTRIQQLHRSQTNGKIPMAPTLLVLPSYGVKNGDGADSKIHHPSQVGRSPAQPTRPGVINMAIFIRFIQQVLRALCRFLAIACVVFALTSSPVNAKGGGGRSSYSGGGGFSFMSSIMSESSSSSGSSSSSSSSASEKSSTGSASPSSSTTTAGSPSSTTKSPNSQASSGSSPSKSKESSSKPTSPKPASSERPSQSPRSRSYGWAGGRAQRGTRSSGGNEAAGVQRGTAKPSGWPASPRRRRQSTTAPKPSSSSAFFRSPLRTIMQHDEQQQLVIMPPQREAVRPAAVAPNLPQSGTAPVVPSSPRNNPWPGRLLWTGIGVGSTAVWYETSAQDHRRRGSQNDGTTTTTLADHDSFADKTLVDASSLNLIDEQTTSKFFDPTRDSGLYRGATVESDGTEQSVETSLTFSEDGRVTGQGFDAEDGPYQINGRWRGSKANWTETYGNYSVRVSCQRQPGEECELECDFVSSFDIEGKFTLSKQ